MKPAPKRLFVDNKKDHGTVVLNWVGTPEREFTWYGEAFHDAGRSLVEQLKRDVDFGIDGPPPDSFKALPIVFMYRHAMELYLKGIILAGSGILPLRGEPEADLKALMSVHSLSRLLEDVERIFQCLGWGWDFKEPYFRSREDFRAAISELDGVDGRSFAFRYPTQKDGKSAALASHFRFNLFEFCEVLDPIYSILDGAAFGAYEMLQLEYEARAEAMQSEFEGADFGDGDFEPPEYEPERYDYSE
jgi:hypothetical protein